MSWFYEIRRSDNQLVDRKGGFASEEEALAVGGEKTRKLVSSQGAPGGTEVLTLMAGRPKVYSIRHGGSIIEYEVDNPPPTRDDDDLFAKWVAAPQDENTRKELERRGIRRVN